MKTLIIAAACLCSFTLLSGCASSKPNQHTTKKLSAEQYQELRQFLTAQSGYALKDTIIIKFDFNSSTCWRTMDGWDQNLIQGSINRNTERINQATSTRPGISVFQYRQAGNKINKLKKWDPNVKIDPGFLRKMLFHQKQICGTSAIIFPDGRYLLTSSDSHFTALHFSGAQIAAMTKN